MRVQLCYEPSYRLCSVLHHLEVFPPQISATASQASLLCIKLLERVERPTYPRSRAVARRKHECLWVEDLVTVEGCFSDSLEDSGSSVSQRCDKKAMDSTWREVLNSRDGVDGVGGLEQRRRPWPANRVILWAESAPLRYRRHHFDDFDHFPISNSFRPFSRLSLCAETARSLK